MARPPFSSCDVSLLRSPEWIEDYGAHVGGYVWLDLREMGAEGLAEVLSIEPAPEIEPLPEGCDPSEYGLVTGTFQHTSGEVYDLKLASESKPIGVTGTHPFWSVDREAWVSVLDLEIGETLKTLDGTTVVESRVRRPGSEPVYNIEVEGDHVYRVGESGVLVHNQSAPNCCDPPVDIKSSSATLGTNLGSGPNADVAPNTVSTTTGSPQAHHIVPGADRRAEELREVLFEPPVCIGINEAINGVWLPWRSSSSNNIATPKRVFHNHTLPDTYFQYVLRLLQPVRGNKTGVESVLARLRREMSSGTAGWMPGEDPTAST